MNVNPRLTATTCALACVYSVIGLYRHWHFGSNAFDLGIFDQAVWHLSRFEAPASTISGYSNILGDHFYPILILFAPLYWLFPAPETLIVAQGGLFAASIIPVFLYLRDRLSSGPALTLTIAYGLFWGMQRAVEFDVHEIAFAPATIAVAILAMERHNWRLLWAALLILMLIKEDLIPLVTVFGAYVWLRHGQRGMGIAVIVLSMAVFAIVAAVVIPNLSDGRQFNYQGAYTHAVTQPWTIPATLVNPPVKLRTALLWLLPFLLLPLRSPLVILLAPFVVSRFLSSSPNHWGVAFHYTAPIAPILAMAAGDGLSRIVSRSGLPRSALRWQRVAAAATLVLCAILPGNQPVWDLFEPSHYTTTTFHETGRAAIARIPREASVVAHSAIAPHLSQRRQIHVLKAGAPDADYVISVMGLGAWPAASEAELTTLLEERQSRGYTVVFQENGWTVLARKS